MATLSPVKPDMQAQSAQVQRINNILNGVAGAGVPVKLVALRSREDPALTVRNLNPDGVHVRILSSDPTNDVPVLEITDSGATVSGVDLPTASSDSLLTNKRVSFLDYVMQAPPSNPPPGRLRVFGNIGTGGMSTIAPDGTIKTLTNSDDVLTGFSGASIYKVNTQSIPNNTPTTLTFSGILYDRGSPNYYNTGATDRLGLGFSTNDPHRIRAVIYFDINATGLRTVQLTLHPSVGGTIVLAKNTVAAVSGVPTVVDVESTYLIGPGDYITVDVTQTSGGALNVLNAVAGQNPASLFEIALQQGMALSTVGGSGSGGIDYVHQFLVAGV